MAILLVQVAKDDIKGIRLLEVVYNTKIKKKAFRVKIFKKF